MFWNKLYILRKCSTMAKNSFFITTPIYYVNAGPHIGHLYSSIIADAFCRFQRLKNKHQNIHLCTGTDEHGSKIQQAAEQFNVPVSEYCENISNSYCKVFRDAIISNTDFIRTTEERHEQSVQAFWKNLENSGFTYVSKYSGWYSVPDETFLTDTQIREDENTKIKYSLESGHPVEWTSETNYMFRLSEFQQKIIDWVNSGNIVRPKKFEKILLSMLNEPLPDISISRPRSRVYWAVQVPNDQSQTVYVWLDALINYLTSCGYPSNQYTQLWPPDIQVIGKDILKFHGIYWPAFLMAADMEPPKKLFVHSHWTVDGEKMSKSKGNVIDPQEISKLYTMEGLRYFLLREGVAHSDGNYSDIKALRILNSELADTLGNLLSRVCAKSLNPNQQYAHVDNDIYNILLRESCVMRLRDQLFSLGETCARHYDDGNFYMVVDTVMSTLHTANNFFETLRPWELKSEAIYMAAPNESNSKKLETIIGMTMDVLRMCGIVLQPIVPQLSGRLLDKLNVPLDKRLWENLNQNFTAPVKYFDFEFAQQLLGNTDPILFRRIIPSIDQNALESDGIVEKDANKQQQKKVAQKAIK